MRLSSHTGRHRLSGSSNGLDAFAVAVAAPSERHQNPNRAPPAAKPNPNTVPTTTSASVWHRFAIRDHPIAIIQSPPTTTIHGRHSAGAPDHAPPTNLATVVACPDGKPGSPPTAPPSQNASQEKAPAGRSAHRPPSDRATATSFNPATAPFAAIIPPRSQTHAIRLVHSHRTIGAASVPTNVSDTALATVTIPTQPYAFSVFHDSSSCTADTMPAA